MANISLFKTPTQPEFGPRDIFGGGRAKTFFNSDTFTVPDGVTTLRVTVHGAGGDGQLVSASTYRGTPGGGGGGCAIKNITTIPGTSYAVTVGTSASASSSFDTECSATGGVTPSGGYTGGAGGTGTGGDINLTGGSGGSASSNSYRSGGGGGAGYGGKNGSSGGGTQSGGGGGGLGEEGTTTYGGGSNGGGSTFLNNTTDETLGFTPLHILDLYPLTGARRYAGTSNIDGLLDGGPGCGGAPYSSSTSTQTRPGKGGILGGGAGAQYGASAGNARAGANGGIGAGGGGNYSNTSAVGLGGPGFVIVEW